MNYFYRTLLLAAALTLQPLVTAAEPLRILPADQRPQDSRLEPLKDLNGYFPFKVAESPRQWEKRAAFVQRRLLVSLGLWPLPIKAPLNAVVHGRTDQGDYTVEKVYFESMPGFYVTGNLYRPKAKQGKRPGILCPHGHWENGRFHDDGPENVRKKIAEGAERFEEGGRSPLQARCVQLARMGCVVFHYDMLGYADSVQIPFEVAHRFATQRPQMNTAENWGLFSTQAETHLQSVMGLQTYNSIRALDFLTELPDVDPSRIAVTGASGGGTQTFILAAIDPRPAVSFPAVMVSTAMQGGCTCENACLLRIDTGNVEFAALFAPKPQGLTSADDWTKEMETKGFPELQQHYKMMGAPDHVELTALTHFGHNYNHVSRAAMYDWMNKHLKLGLDAPVIEEDYRLLGREQLTVWNDQHPQPEGGADFERKLLRWWTEDANQQLDAALPHEQEDLEKFREIYGGGIDVLIGRRLPDGDDLDYEQTIKEDRGDYLEMAGLLRNTKHNEELPIVFLFPDQWEGRVVVWITEQGKAGLYDEDGNPCEAVHRLLDSGASVVGVDLLFQGEFLADGERHEQTRRVENPREFAGYTFGYNHPLFAQRVHDILNVISFVRGHDYQPEQVDLIGLGQAGRWVAAARAQAGDAVTKAAVDTEGFRFSELKEIHDPDFLPGGAKYGDLPGMLALSAPNPLWLTGEEDAPPDVVASVYSAAGAEDQLTLYTGPEDREAAACIDWLIGR